MLSTLAKNIIIRAMRIQKERGVDPAEILKGYKNLTEIEKAEILKEV